MVQKFVLLFNLNMMATFVLLLAVTCLTWVNGQGQRQGQSVTAKNRVVHGFTNCGSAAEILQVIASNCSQTPCELQTGETYVLAAYFKLKESHLALTTKLTCRQGETETTIANLTQAVDVEAGLIASFVYPIAVTSALGQGLATFRVTVGDGPLTELCFEVTGNIHN